MYIADKDGLGILFTCASTDAIGSPVRLISSTTVATADASEPFKTQIIGFIRAKPTPTTCYLTQNYYYSAASGFSGFSGVNGSTGVGSPVYLTNASGFSGQPGNASKILGEAISPREAFVYANPIEAQKNPFQGFKNRFINGDMQVAQRNVGPTASPGNGSIYCDRWYNMYAYGGTPTISQDTDVPTVAQAGRKYYKSLKISSTQDATVAAGDIVGFYQVIEGYNIADIFGDGYNTGFTISFWVKSSTVGIYSCTICDATLTRVYAAEYVVNVANTWEKKSFTVTAAPSGGTWSSTNAAGCFIFFTLMAGTSWNASTPNAWATVSDERASPNQVNWCGPVGTSNFNLTGVQLEAGLVATPFDNRSYQTELALCQRYAQVIETTNGANGMVALGFAFANNGAVLLRFLHVPMRAFPTLEATAADWAVSDADVATDVTSMSITSSMFSLGTTIRFVIGVAGTPLTQFRPYYLHGDGTSNSKIILNSEL